MSRRIKILGQDNFVDSSADRILVIGNNNQVFGKVENVVIVGDNQIVEESNIVVIDGDVKRFNYNDAGNRLVWTDTANNNTDANTTYYLADTSTNNITFILSVNEADYYPGMEFNFKKLASANRVFINAGTKTIDGSAVVQINSRYTNLTIVYDGFNYHIV
jgi:hypothetical protein